MTLSWQIIVQMTLHMQIPALGTNLAWKITGMIQISNFSTDLPVLKNDSQEVFVSHLQTQIQSSSGQGLSQTILVSLYHVSLTCILEAVQASISAVVWQEIGTSPNSCTEKQAHLQAFRLVLCILSECCCRFLTDICEIWASDLTLPSDPCAALWGMNHREYYQCTALNSLKIWRYISATWLLQRWCCLSNY